MTDQPGGQAQGRLRLFAARLLDYQCLDVATRCRSTADQRFERIALDAEAQEHVRQQRVLLEPAADRNDGERKRIGERRGSLRNGRRPGQRRPRGPEHRTGVEHGFWPDDRRVVTTEARRRPGSSDVMALRVGHEKLTRETGWQPRVSWEEGILRTIRWYAENREGWIGRVDWLPTGAPKLVTG